MAGSRQGLDEGSQISEQQAFTVLESRIILKVER